MVNFSLVATVISCLTVAYSSVECSVDYTSPDLSVFKLRHVSSKQFSRGRADDSIEELATGAQFMRESLYVNDFQVRCISYGHLLKLINNRRQQQEAKPSRSAIRQNVVQALAQVADVDRAIYFGIFKFYQYPQVPQLFQEAIEQLEDRIESNNVALDAWHDLIRCSAAYFPRMDTFLKEPKRAKTLADFERFKSIPMGEEFDQWAAEGRLRPQVGRLVSQYDGQEPQVLAIDEADLNEARALVEALDDDELTLLRRRIEQDIENGRRFDVNDDGEEEAAEQVPADLPAGKTDNSSDNHNVDGIKIVITIPDDSEVKVDTNNEQSNNNSGDDSSQLKLHEDESIRARLLTLVFIKRRLNSKPELLNGSPKLSINLALDFIIHWNDLREGLKAQRSSSTGRGEAKLVWLVSDFLANPENQEIERRLQQVVANYRLLVEELALMEEKRRNKRYSSIDELRRNYGQVFDILRKIDRAFDIYDITRALGLMKRKELKEYETMNAFINGDIHW